MVAGTIVLLMLFMWSQSRRITAAAPPMEKGSVFDALKSKWAALGGLSIFVYVGAEVAIASLMINFLMQPDVLRAALDNPDGTRMLGGLAHFEGAAAERAGKMLGWLYWFGAMVGRFIGSWLLARIQAPKLLATFAFVASALCFVVSQSHGELAAYAALSIGLFNSIMFPTIFTITLERSTATVAGTSGLLCMSIVGGAFIPQVVARIADAGHLHASYFVPMICYLMIVAFAIAALRAPIVSHGVARSSGH
jgi:FHS family L-fucose permease-like MFS transporter